MLVNKFAIARPVTGPLPHILEAILEAATGRDSATILPELIRALIHCIKMLVRESSGQEITGRAQGLLERACVFLQGHYQYDITPGICRAPVWGDAQSSFPLVSNPRQHDVQ